MVFQDNIAVEQWNPNYLDAKQLYDQIKYLINYYNYYTNQHEFISNNQSSNWSSNIVYNNSMPTNITNVIPISKVQMDKRTNEKQTTIMPKFQRKNKLLLPRIPNIRPLKLMKPKFRPVFYKPYNSK